MSRQSWCRSLLLGIKRRSISFCMMGLVFKHCVAIQGERISSFQGNSYQTTCTSSRNYLIMNRDSQVKEANHDFPPPTSLPATSPTPLTPCFGLPSRSESTLGSSTLAILDPCGPYVPLGAFNPLSVPYFGVPAPSCSAPVSFPACPTFCVFACSVLVVRGSTWLFELRTAAEG